MKNHPYQSLSMRERQIMDALHQMGEGSVSEVLEKIPNPAGYNSVRILMKILEKKGFINHRNDKNKYIYAPILKKDEAKKSAIDHLLTTHFDRSVPQVVSALLSHKDISEAELEQLATMIEQAKKNATDDGPA
jgi:predicted transcriptional regulator